MENGILIAVVAIVAAVSGAAVAMLVLRRRSPEQAELIMEALAAVARMVSELVSDEEIEAVANWAYDAFGLSDYYTREAWVAFCKRLIPEAEQTARSLRGRHSPQ